MKFAGVAITLFFPSIVSGLNTATAFSNDDGT